jgi:pyridoxamine 5'-phosphate oxidase
VKRPWQYFLTSLPTRAKALHYEDFRREYLSDGLSRESLDPCPIAQFEAWLAQAVEGGLRDPTAMVVATVDAQGWPWQRIVLLKDVSTKGFVFYTNYGSAKAQAMAHEPRVSLHFPWNELERQVSVAGTVEKMSVMESTRYFLSRPRESQIAAWASQQSRPISTRAMLVKQVMSMKEKFGNGDIPLPDFWGGYRVVPKRIEFWQGGEHRLHDRFLYSLQSSGAWDISQLQP